MSLSDLLGRASPVYDYYATDRKILDDYKGEDVNAFIKQAQARARRPVLRACQLHLLRRADR